MEALTKALIETLPVIILLGGMIIFGIVFFFFTRKYPRKETHEKN